MKRRAARTLRQRTRKKKRRKKRPPQQREKGWLVKFRRVDFKEHEEATRFFPPGKRRNMVLFIMGIVADPDASIIATERVVKP